MAFFSPSTRPLAWAGFVLIGFSCVWFVALLVMGVRPEDEGEGVSAAETAAPSAPTQVGAQAQAARPSPLAPAPLTPSAAVPGALNPTQRLDERAAPAAPVSQTAANAASASAQGLPSTSTQSPTTATVQTASAAVPPAGAAPPPAQTQAPAPQTQMQPAAAPATGPGARELTRGLAVRGHTVHASVSGHSASTTLSVSGRTLTRDACIQWLADPKARDGLRAAGVRVVVATNGTQSWTFML